MAGRPRAHRPGTAQSVMGREQAGLDALFASGVHGVARNTGRGTECHDDDIGIVAEILLGELLGRLDLVVTLITVAVGLVEQIGIEIEEFAMLCSRLPWYPYTPTACRDALLWLGSSTGSIIWPSRPSSKIITGAVLVRDVERLGET